MHRLYFFIGYFGEKLTSLECRPSEDRTILKNFFDKHFSCFNVFYFINSLIHR